MMQLVLQQCVVCIGTLWIDLFDFQCQLRGEKQSFCHISPQVGYHFVVDGEEVKGVVRRWNRTSVWNKTFDNLSLNFGKHLGGNNLPILSSLYRKTEEIFLKFCDDFPVRNFR